MHIAYVITRADVLGGAGIHVVDLVLGVRNAGFRVSACVGTQGVLSDRLNSHGVTTYHISSLKREINIFSDIRAFFQLRSVLLKIKPDLVHLHSSKAGVIGRLVAKSLNIPAIFTAHGWAFTEGIPPLKRNIYKFIERRMSEYTSHIIAVSEYDRRLALESKVCRPNSITTILNGIHDAKRTRLDREATHVVSMIMVARFDEPKDQSLLIEALSTLPMRNWTLDFIGDGPRLQTCEKKAAAFGLKDRVKFNGAVDTVPAYLAKADIFILVSNWEGLPLSILEAMRAGLPVIASDVGGVREAVEDGVTGFVVERGSLSALRAAICSLVSDGEVREMMGTRGRHKYEREFSYQNMLSQTLNIYRKVLRESDGLTSSKAG